MSASQQEMQQRELVFRTREAIQRSNRFFDFYADIRSIFDLKSYAGRIEPYSYIESAQHNYCPFVMRRSKIPEKLRKHIRNIKTKYLELEMVGNTNVLQEIELKKEYR